MPIYEYTCQDCDAHFEKFVRSMTAKAEVKCPAMWGYPYSEGLVCLWHCQVRRWAGRSGLVGGQFM